MGRHATSALPVRFGSMLSKKSVARTVGGAAWLMWQILGLVQALGLAMGRRPQRSRHQLTQRNSRAGGLWWRSDEAQGQRLEVLHYGREMELVAGTRETAQSQPLEAMVGLQVCEAHLDPLALIA